MIQSLVKILLALFFIAVVLVPLTLLALGYTLMATVVGVVLIGLAVLYLAQSFVTIDQSELAFRLRLGEYAGGLEPGPHLVWFMFDKIVTVSKNINGSDLPDSPHKIYHGDVNKKKADGSPGDGVVPKGYTPALRVMFSDLKITKPYDVMVGKIDENGVRSETEMQKIGTIHPNDGLLKGQAAEVELSYGFRVKDDPEELRKFYESIGSIDNARRDMNDHVTGGVVAKLQRMCPREATLKLKSVAEDIKAELVEYTSKWGIEIAFVRMKVIGFSHDFNSAMSDAATAIERKKDIVTTSEGTKTKLTNEGKGAANAREAQLAAEAKGFALVAQVAASGGGQFVIANDTARAVAKESTLVVSDQGMLGGMAQIGKVLTHTMSQNKPAQVIPTSTPAETARPTQPDTASSNSGQASSTPQAKSRQNKRSRNRKDGN